MPQNKTTSCRLRAYARSVVEHWPRFQRHAVTGEAGDSRAALPRARFGTSARNAGDMLTLLSGFVGRGAFVTASDLDAAPHCARDRDQPSEVYDSAASSRQWILGCDQCTLGPLDPAICQACFLAKRSRLCRRRRLDSHFRRGTEFVCPRTMSDLMWTVVSATGRGLLLRSMPCLWTLQSVRRNNTRSAGFSLRVRTRFTARYFLAGPGHARHLALHPQPLAEVRGLGAERVEVTCCCARVWRGLLAEAALRLHVALRDDIERGVQDLTEAVLRLLRCRFEASVVSGTHSTTTADRRLLELGGHSPARPV